MTPTLRLGQTLHALCRAIQREAPDKGQRRAANLWRGIIGQQLRAAYPGVPLDGQPSAATAKPSARRAPRPLIPIINQTQNG